MPHTRQEPHTISSSQIATVPSRTPVRPGFRSGPYLEKLLAELDRAQINARIKLARDEAGLTQPELGEILSVHWRTVQTWEDLKGGRVPWDRLDEIAKATGRTRDWLLHGEEPVDQERLAALLGRLELLVTRLEAAQAEPQDG